MTDPSLDQVVDQILSDSTFLKLKKVIENVPQIHDHEDVYSHSIRTMEVAKSFINNPPLTNPDAKKRFIEFIEEKVMDKSRKDLMIITALLHDTGKILQFEEKGDIRTLGTNRPSSSDDTTYFPGHEYYGSQYVVPVILKDILSKSHIQYIQNLVRLHDTFNSYFPKDWTDEEILNDIKFRAEGFYIEMLFNSYCDIYYSEFFKATRAINLKFLNMPGLYDPRKYSIID